MASGDLAIAAVLAYIDLFPIGDGLEIDLARGENKSELIAGFRALGYEVQECSDGWRFFVRPVGSTKEADESGSYRYMESP